MVPSFYQTVDTGIISLIKPAPDSHNHPSSSYFFCPNPKDFLYDLLTLISNVRHSDCIKSPLGDLGVRNEESKVRPLIH